MARLTSKARAALPAAKFALPATRSYPVQDASHARNALARAAEMANKGAISPSTKAKIDAAAHCALKGK